MEQVLLVGLPRSADRRCHHHEARLKLFTRPIRRKLAILYIEIILICLKVSSVIVSTESEAGAVEVVGVDIDIETETGAVFIFETGFGFFTDVLIEIKKMS